MGSAAHDVLRQTAKIGRMGHCSKELTSRKPELFDM